MVKRKYIPNRGDIVWLDFSPQSGHEQAGRRPALVVSANRFNAGGLIFACPITSKIKNHPFEVSLTTKKIQGCVLSNHIKSLDWRARNIKFIEHASDATLLKVHKIISGILLS